MSETGWIKSMPQKATFMLLFGKLFSVKLSSIRGDKNTFISPGGRA